MKSPLSRAVLLFLKFGISIAGLLYAFWNLDFERLATFGVVWTYIALAVLMSFASVILHGLRWRSLIKSDRPSVLIAICGQLVGIFGNNIFPFRAGEFLKTQYVYSRTSNRLAPLLGSVASERGLDILMILLMAICLVASHPRLEALIKREELALVVSLILVCGLLAMFARRFLLGWLPERIRRSVEDFISVLTDVRAVSLAGSITLLLFASYAIRFHLVLSGVHVQPNLPLLGLLLVATAAGFLIPAAPGAIGTYHAAVVYVLVSIHGMEKTTAQMCAIYLHITSYLPSTLVGFVIFLLSGTRFEKQHSTQDSSR